ncbi:hypothetical protein Z043_117433 [Scleropages formosus]|uniref:Reelin n=1 Tax=Scleropages formosus TaxID=113540 RepID=A0A0P7UW99_SCLFO|nr:hypothetical protein Z043_117433 [Scleropages formosus]
MQGFKAFAGLAGRTGNMPVPNETRREAGAAAVGVGRMMPERQYGTQFVCSVVASHVSHQPSMSFSFVWIAPPPGTGCINFLLPKGVAVTLTCSLGYSTHPLLSPAQGGLQEKVVPVCHPAVLSLTASNEDRKDSKAGASCWSTTALCPPQVSLPGRLGVSRVGHQDRPSSCCLLFLLITSRGGLWEEGVWEEGFDISYIFLWLRAHHKDNIACVSALRFRHSNRWMSKSACNSCETHSPGEGSGVDSMPPGPCDNLPSLVSDCHAHSLAPNVRTCPKSEQQGIKKPAHLHTLVAESYLRNPSPKRSRLEVGLKPAPFGFKGSGTNHYTTSCPRFKTQLPGETAPTESPQRPILAEIHGNHVILRDDFDSNSQEELDSRIWSGCGGCEVGERCGILMHGRAVTFCEPLAQRELITRPLNTSTASFLQFALGRQNCKVLTAQTKKTNDGA